MTNELEKTFFDTFGIEPFIYCSKPRLDCDARSKGFCKKDCGYYSSVLYPEITDRILLELIRLGLNYDFVIHAKSKDELKEKLLILLIHNDAEFKHQVQSLFEEEEKRELELRKENK